MKKITAEELKTLIDKEDILVIDLRNDEDYALGHIPTALNMPLNAVAHEVEDRTEDKDSKICLYCYSGNRSSKAGIMLEFLEYTNVYNLGGIDNWTFQLER